MSDDLLARATRALREEHADNARSAKFTRARVLSSVQESTIRRRTRLVFLLPFAACFLVASAWAAGATRLPEFTRGMMRALGFTRPTESAGLDALPASAVRPLAKAKLRATPSEVAAAPIPEPVAPTAQPAAAETPVTRPPDLGAVQQPTLRSAAKREEAARPDVFHALYRDAHRAHFSEHDFVRALAGWDAYLRAAPSGRFAMEAAYNRALCLVRLGRTSEARAALAPFAQGKPEAYRQREAQALREALTP